MIGKNLFDIEKDFKSIELFLNENNEYITAIEISPFTLDYIQSRGIYGFANYNNQKIDMIINDKIPNFCIEIHREKKEVPKNEI